MQDEFPRRKWRHRRLAVVGVMLILVCLFSRWIQPSRDERILGRWRVGIATEGPAFITFQSDGIAIAEFEGGERVDIRWAIESDAILFNGKKRQPIIFSGEDQIWIGKEGQVGFSILNRVTE